MRVAILAALLILTACCTTRPQAQSSVTPSPTPLASTTTVSPSSSPGGSRMTWSAPVTIEVQPSPAVDGLRDISCPSINLCVGVVDNGDAVLSTSPKGDAAAWMLTPIDKAENGLTGVSCPSTSLCVAVDMSGNVVTSSDPTGGSGAWTVTRVAGLSFTDISCPTVGFCAAVDVDGHAFISTNPMGGPNAWSLIDLTRGIPYGFPTQGISCPSPGFCAIAASGSVFTSTSPSAGAAAWKETVLAGASLPQGVFCLSANLCFAFDDMGQIFRSANPAAKSPTWRLTANATVNDLTCPTADFCVAVTYDGVITSRGPANTGEAWTGPENIGGDVWLSISCPSPDICIAGDASTNIVVGRSSQ